MEDVYFTILNSASHELKVKGSRFIGLISPVQDRNDAEKIIREIKNKYHDATHHCYAYRFGLENPVEFRYNDDGEPSGTAGRPILDVLEGKDITNIICVVSRYFGGVKLGTGGLARAYGQCASETLARVEIVEKFILYPISITFNYDLTGTIMSLISKYQCQMINTQYGEETVIRLNIRQSQRNTFQTDLRNQTAGKVQFRDLKEV